MGAESTSCGVGLADAGPLVDALANPSPEARLAVFRALTSLPLDRDAWFAVRPYAIAAVGDRSMPEHLDAIDLAARVPVRSVRVDLWRLAETGEPEERRRSAFALARARDVRAVGPLIMLLVDPAVATAASRHLALVDVSASADLLSQRCAELPKDAGADWVRFWLALALARCGRGEALEPALERLKEGNAELDLRWGDESAWGDPDLLLAELRQGPPLPEATLERLRGGRQPGLLTALLLRAAEAVVAAGPAVADPGGFERPSPAERARVKEAIDRSSIPRELAGGGDALPGSLERLVDRLAAGSGRTTVLSLSVSEFFRRGDPHSLGSGNAAVEVIAASGDAYVPDVEGLLEAHTRLGQAPDGGLRAQIAWASSRRGLGFLLRGLAHRLPGDAVAVAGLVVDAAAYERASEPPRFFAGPPDLPVPSPPDELIEDMATANGGGGQHAKPPTRGLPPRDEEVVPAAPAEPPTRGVPRNGEPTDAEPAPAESRWVLAQVSDLHDPARPQVLERAFRSGAPHQVTVRIGPREIGWIAPASGSSFDDALGSVEGSQPLTVTFLAAAGAPPQQAVVYLPPRGPSTACAFSFQPDPAFAAFEAQIHVFHRNRLVQLALLHGPVCADPADAPEDARIELQLAAIVPGSAGLENRERFDAAVARTAARTGGGATAGVADDQLVVFDNDRIERSIPALSRTLKDLATSDAARRRDLADPSSVEHLRDLAFQGRELYDVIGQPIVDRLAASERGLERLQVLVESASDFFPVEFVYDLPPPQDDATLCPGWKTALRTGRCPEAHEPAGPRRLCPTVCPSGFWSVSKVIERQVLGDESWTTADLRGAEFAVRAAVGTGRNALAPPSVVLFAASDRVDQVKPGQIAAVRKTLDRAAQASGYAETWDDWVLSVGRLSPTLLVLLSHTTEIGASLALEIGAEQRCRISQLLPEYVRASTDQRPIVLLLGCETAVSDFGLQTFVARFQDLGAALVVGTVASVLGQRAASVASAVATELTRASARRTPVRAGDLLRDVRRRLLAKGELTALCLTAFGDADWQLGGD